MRLQYICQDMSSMAVLGYNQKLGEQSKKLAFQKLLVTRAIATVTFMMVLLENSSWGTPKEATDIKYVIARIRKILITQNHGFRRRGT